MGERALSEAATEDDIRAMEAAVSAALKAGAIGFSTSRSSTHTTPDGSPVASRIADWHEIDRLVGVMGTLGGGIFQIGPDVSGGAAQRAFLDRLRRVALESGRPVMFGLISTRQGDKPNPWQYQTEFLDQSSAMGAVMWGQATTKSINAVFSLKSYLPFDVLPAWREVRGLPLEEQRRRLADPAVRARLIADEGTMKPRDNVFQGGAGATTDPRKPDYGNLFAMKGVGWDDDPTVETLSRERRKHPVEIILDLSVENPDQLYVQPLVNESPDAVQGILSHPRTLATFSDSGAHVCQEMGSSLQTHMLSYWVRKRRAFTLEQAVKMLTADNADAWGMADRGRLKEGMAADIVVFDEDRVSPCMPTVEADLPGGARRLVQKAEGIACTVVNGVPTFENGKATGERPGTVIKGPLAKGA
jgi:N-acyl-D-aspartate/D-glutamate deacylase